MSSRFIATLAVASLFFGSSCSASQAGEAAVAAAFHVAETAAYVEAFDGCWGDCAFGTRCNPKTQLCEPYKEGEGIEPSTIRAAPLSVCAISMKPGGACSEGDRDCLLDASCATVCACEAGAEGEALSWACAGPPCEPALRPSQ